MNLSAKDGKVVGTFFFLQIFTYCSRLEAVRILTVLAYNDITVRYPIARLFYYVFKKNQASFLLFTGENFLSFMEKVVKCYVR